jgi:hypothetical protein
MFKILIDTCVWLDLAKDPRQEPLLAAVEEMVRTGIISLVVPRLIFEEFKRNRDRISKESAKSLSSHFRIVKDAVGKIGGDKRKARSVLSYLDDVDHKIPIIGGSAADTLDRIEKLLTASSIIEPCEAVTLRAAQRAMEKKAPFHRDKNAIADAIIIETYAEFMRNEPTSKVRFAFVTHNKKDFSIENGNQKIPHPDIADYFSRIKSLYFINLTEALRRIEPSLVADIKFEHTWMEEPRGITEILDAEDLLYHQVWYNRHCNLLFGIEDGTIKVVEKETYPHEVGARETIQRDILKAAIKAGKKVERRYGKENLGPWDDFEWGMINGKLSALRWVLGDDWDMLDT